MATHAGKRYYIVTGLSPNDLADLAAFEALTWTTEVKGIGAFPAYGGRQELASYQTFEKARKGLGAPDYGGGDIEVFRISGDTGQAAMLTAGGKNTHVAFKIVYLDATGTADGEYTATTHYVKGVLAKPELNAGSDSDAILDVYGFGIEQVERDEPAEISS